MWKSILLLALLYSLSTSFASGSFQLENGFEYVGTAEGKIFTSPILAEEEKYGVTWQRAIELCVEAGYRLATITSQIQDDVIGDYVMTSGQKWAWIDGTDFITQHSYFSINTGLNLTYFNWIPQRPSNGHNRTTCIRWANNLFGAGWWDVGCNDKLDVICELYA